MSRQCHTVCFRAAIVGSLILVLVVTVFVMAFLHRQSESRATPSGVSGEPSSEVVPAAVASRMPEEPRFKEARARMVRGDLASRDIRDPRVLEVMGRVPRQEFIPAHLADEAYRDGPLPIGYSQTISQPYIVALMTQLVQPKPTSRALDIGTGSGYQAAVLSELCKDVYSIEIVEPLAKSAKGRLAEMGYRNVTVRHGDGYRGWKEHAPFDCIVVAAAADHVPKPLVEQLAPGGRLVMPVGRLFQELLLIEKQADGSVVRKQIAAVAFVPMTGEAREEERRESDD